MSTTRGYGPLLRTSGALAFTVSALVGRLPIAMLGIGTVLLVEDRRSSYALAGLVSAAYAAGTALLGPALSRLVDRLGQRRVLPGALLVSAAGIVGLVALVGTSAPVWTLLVCALGFTLAFAAITLAATRAAVMERRVRALQMAAARRAEAPMLAAGA